MRRLIEGTVKGAAARMGLVVLRRRKFEAIEAQRRALFEALKGATRRPAPVGPHPATGIVFSRDRPMQLHALLASYFDRARRPAPLEVLYATSSPRFARAYDQVSDLFRDKAVRLRSESCFYDDLIEVLETVPSEKLFFLVDDLVFVEDVDMADFAALDVERFVPSLRLGKNLRRCYTVGRAQPLPPFSRDVIDTPDKVCWRWRDGKFDWGYPLSVDGHLFSTLDVMLMAKVSAFTGPNSLEGALQDFNVCFQDRYGVCYTKSKVLNIPCNKVQTENQNISGKIDKDFLLERWERGYRIDYGRLYGFVNISAHQDLELPLVRDARASAVPVFT